MSIRQTAVFLAGFLSIALCAEPDSTTFKGPMALTPDSWHPRNPEQVEVKAGAPGELLFEVKPGSSEWTVLDGPVIQIPKRDKFALGRAILISGEAKAENAEGYCVQIRLRPNGGKGYTRNRTPHSLWETSLEIVQGEKMKSWTAIEGSSTFPYDCGSLACELWLAVPKTKASTTALRGIELKEDFKKAHLIGSEPWTKGNIFFKDSGVMKVEFADAKNLTSWSVKAVDEDGRVLISKEGQGVTVPFQVELPSKGFYKLTASGSYADASKIENTVTAAVVGAPLPDSIRLNSRFGSMRVHGSGEIWKDSGCNWDWSIGAIQLKDWILNADGSISPPPNWKPLKNPSDHSTVMTVGSFPKWLYGPNVKGDGLYPPKDWDLFERLFEAFAKANPELTMFCPYNEPNASWRGSSDDFVKFNKSMAIGVKRGNPKMQVFGPCLYSILMDDFRKLVKGGVYDVQEGVVMHAYVNGTPPEGEFIDRVQQMVDCLKEAGKGDLPIHFTEFGWCSGTGDWQKTISAIDRARYVVRSLSLLTAKPVDNISYFCFHYEGGAGNGDGEPGYSLLNNNGTPTASYVSFVNTLKWLSEIKKGDARWFRLSPNLNMVLGKAGSKIVGVAWTGEGEETFEIPGVPLRLEDMMGRAISIQEGSKTVKLSPSPLFFELPSDCQFMGIGELPLLSGAPGASFKLKLKDSASLAGLGVSGDSLKISPNAKPGSYLLIGKDSSGVWAGQPVKVLPPLEFVNLDCNVLPDGKKMEAVARVYPEIDGKVKCSLCLDSGENAEVEAKISKKSEASFAIPVPGFQTGKRIKGVFKVETLGDVPFTVERDFDQTILDCPVLPEDLLQGVDWSGIEGVDISSWGPWPKPIEASDCSARLKTAIGKTGFHLRVEVKDDFHYQICSPAGMWQEDSIQFAFDVDAGTPWLYNNIGDGRFNGHRIFEYGVAQSSKGGSPMIWRWRADAPDMKANCTEPAIVATVKFPQKKYNADYDVFLPWATLGLKEAPSAGSQIGFSLAVNDVDKGNDRHVLRFGNGIIDSKDPERYARLRIVQAP